MRIIKPSATVMKHTIDPYKFIEQVGRKCYKSEDKIEEGSAEKFVKNLIKRNHWAMLEHETLYLVVSETFMKDFNEDTIDFDASKFFNISYDGDKYIISGSFRSFHDLFERQIYSYPINYIKSGMQFSYPLVFGEYEEYNGVYYGTDCVLYTRQEFIDLFKDKPEILSHHLTHTFLFVCDRGVSHEFVRHRVASFAQESTRYCNYGKEDEITVIEPCFWEEGENSAYFYEEWYRSCHQAEVSYLNFLSWGASPQQARTVLPNSLKTELVITATEEEWQHIVNLRYLGTTGAPHPQMKEVMGHAVESLNAESEGRVSYETN